ncbi:MAG TPA: NAD(P) transhydrogenase subunit alpha [Halioglobus sp.]
MFDLNNIKFWTKRPHAVRTAASACALWLFSATSFEAQAGTAPLHASVTAEDIAVNLLIFILSTFLGLGLIHGVAKLLHTPLMALTNAISSVSVVAALIVLSYPDNSPLVITLATVGTALALSNVISGFMITERILKMFRKGVR